MVGVEGLELAPCGVQQCLAHSSRQQQTVQKGAKKGFPSCPCACKLQILFCEVEEIGTECDAGSMCLCYSHPDSLFFPLSEVPPELRGSRAVGAGSRYADLVTVLTIPAARCVLVPEHMQLWTEL